MLSFAEYQEQNPDIWDKFKHFAEVTIEKGFKNYSAKGIFELIRWHTGAREAKGFKVNNNYTAAYARKFMQEFPQYKEFFRTRGSE